MGQRDFDEFDEESFEESMHDAAETSGVLSRQRANRFYDRLRTSIRRYLDRKGKLVGTTAEYLLLVPDFFMLLWRLVNDSRVSAKNKMILGSGIAYYIFPLDLIPEALVGAGGYVDDLVFAVFLLSRILRDTDAEVLRQHWSGRDDILETIQKVVSAAENLVGTDLVSKIRKSIK